MAYYYVKTGGTATGDAGRYATQQTGSFAGLGAAGYYPDISAAVAATTAPAGGDFILVSNLSDSTASGHISYSAIGELADYVTTASVDDTAIDQFLKGAKETTGNPFDLSTGSARVHIVGMDITVRDDVYTSAAGGSFYIDDCTVTLTGTGSQIDVSASRTKNLSNNTTYIFQNGQTSAAVFIDSEGSIFDMTGGAIVAGSGTLNNLLGTGSTGQVVARLSGVDISDVTGYILAGAGNSQTSDFTVDVELRGCAISPSITGFVEEDFSRYSHRFLATNCAATSAAAEYQYYLKTWAGEVEDDTQIYRNESIAFPSGAKASQKATTLADVGLGKPLVFTSGTRYANLAQAGSDTIRIYFVSTTALTDTEVWAEVNYPDGTNQHVYNQASNRAADILSAGTAHTTDTGSTWKNGAADLVGYNEYYMDIDTSGDAGADCAPDIRIHITKPSVTIYFDTSINLV